MGKHTAAVDAGVHPLVAAALLRRAGARAGAQDEHPEGPTGWPEPPPGREGAVGWPEDMDPEQGGTDEGSTEEQAADGGTDRAVEAVGAAPRRSWWRLFGADRAA